MQNSRILVAEDELEVRRYLQMALKCLGYGVELAQDGDEVLACLRASPGEFDAVLLDVIMPNRDGFDTLYEIRKFDADLPVIMISGVTAPLKIVSAMKSGATDFLGKPVTHEDLQKAIANALGRSDTPYVPTARVAPPNGLFLGNNPRMREIQAVVGQVGWSEAPVLIQGETGTGKEVLARELHARSPRSNKPFLKLNCAALPSELVESELFGYERGAFTGAFQRKAGMFENADGGTLLLDEIGDMDFRLQAKLLQVLQDSSFQRIGGKETIKVDVRVMGATHRDLEKAIAEHSFREDLYYRLNVINIHLPPLRERKEDILPLAEYLLRKHTAKGAVAIPVIPALKQAIMAYHWPGNVRELENYVRKLLIFKDADTIARDLQAKTARKSLVAPSVELQAHLARVGTEESPILEKVVKAKRQAETDAILEALNTTRWNRKQAAALLQIDYKALLYKMKKLRIEGKSTPQGAVAIMKASSNVA
jgi:two-component system, NtrC family, response regulator AtoC